MIILPKGMVIVSRKGIKYDGIVVKGFNDIFLRRLIEGLPHSGLDVIIVDFFMAGTAGLNTDVFCFGFKGGIRILCELTARPNVKNNDGTDG